MILGLHPAHAQSLGRRDTEEIAGAARLPKAAGRVAGELRSREREETFAAWSPGSDDIGQQLILKRRREYQTFRAFATTSVYHTNNVALVQQPRFDDTYLLGEVGLSVLPKITNSLYGEITVRQQFYRYNEFDALDFNSFDAGAGLTYLSRVFGGTAFFTRYEYSRLTNAGDHDEFFTSNTISLGAQKPFQISRAQVLYIGTAAEFALTTDPSFARRHQYSSYIGYNADLTRHLTAQVYFRFSLYDYTDFLDRLDANYVVGGGLTYKFTEWLSASGLASYASNNSNLSGFDYEAVSPGAAVSLNLKF